MSLREDAARKIIERILATWRADIPITKDRWRYANRPAKEALLAAVIDELESYDEQKD